MASLRSGLRRVRSDSLVCARTVIDRDSETEIEPRFETGRNLPLFFATH
jgi:hypothetical protein